jgi:hypothetical protein
MNLLDTPIHDFPESGSVEQLDLDAYLYALLSLPVLLLRYGAIMHRAENFAARVYADYWYAKFSAAPRGMSVHPVVRV